MICEGQTLTKTKSLRDAFSRSDRRWELPTPNRLRHTSSYDVRSWPPVVDTPPLLTWFIHDGNRCCGTVISSSKDRAQRSCDVPSRSPVRPRLKGSSGFRDDYEFFFYDRGRPITVTSRRNEEGLTARVRPASARKAESVRALSLQVKLDRKRKKRKKKKYSQNTVKILSYSIESTVT